MDQLRLPILPLPNIVFFPNTSIPMLVSEPSYVRMIKDTIANDGHIGISMAEPTEEDQYNGSLRYTPQRIGTMGKPILLEELEDGSLKLLVEGSARIELLNVEQNIPYLIYKIKLIPDLKNHVPLSFENAQISRLKEILDLWIEDTIDDSLERESFVQSLGGIHSIVDYLAMFLVGDREVRQVILENRNLHERIQILGSLLKGEYPHCEDDLVANAVKDFEYREKEHYLVH